MANKQLPSASTAGLDVRLREPASEPATSVKARAAMTPNITGAMTAAEYASAGLGDVDLAVAARALTAQIERVHANDLRDGEAALAAQAAALNAIFTELARRAARNMGGCLEVMETYLRLALRAQTQCRATWEAVAAIKNPPVVFAKQANISAGHQQINNGAGALGNRAEKSGNTRNELLEAPHAQLDRLDTRPPRAAGAVNSPVVSMEAGHRPADRSG